MGSDVIWPGGEGFSASHPLRLDRSFAAYPPRARDIPHSNELPPAGIARGSRYDAATQESLAISLKKPQKNQCCRLVANASPLHRTSRPSVG